MNVRHADSPNTLDETSYTTVTFVVSLFQFQLMLIKSRNDKDEVSITLNGHTVESTNDIKLSGVNIDEHLVFSKHISDICVKAEPCPALAMKSRVSSLLT